MRLFKKKPKEDLKFTFINGFPYLMESRRLIKQMKIELLLDPKSVAIATNDGKIKMFTVKGGKIERKPEYVV